MPHLARWIRSIALVTAAGCTDSFDDRRCDRPCAEIDATGGAGGASGGIGGAAGFGSAGVGGGASGQSGTAGKAGASGKGTGGNAGASGAGKGGSGVGGASGKTGAAGSGGAGPTGMGGSSGGGSGMGGSGGAASCVLGDTKCEGGSVKACDAGGQFGAASPCELGCAGGGCVSVVELALGRAHSCARLSDGTVRCWGENAAGQLGRGKAGAPGGKPTPVNGLVDAIELSAGGDHACAIRKDGSVTCWGNSDFGQVGALGASFPTPQALSIPGTISSLAAGARHSCAKDTSGAIWCWGDDLAGQTGGGAIGAPVLPPTMVSGVGASTMIGSGDSRTCAITTGVTCWGSDGFTSGSGAIVNSPAAIAGLTGASAFGMGAFHLCAVTSGNVVKCVGRNDEGQLGLGTSGAATSTTAPAFVGGVTGVERIAGGGRHTCVLQTGGVVACWGDATNGQIGEGTIGAGMIVSAPAMLSSIVAVEIAAGDAHSCAITGSGKVACWGANASGQLGNGNINDEATPVEVSF